MRLKKSKRKAEFKRRSMAMKKGKSSRIDRRKEEKPALISIINLHADRPHPPHSYVYTTPPDDYEEK